MQQFTAIGKSLTSAVMAAFLAAAVPVVGTAQTPAPRVRRTAPPPTQEPPAEPQAPAEEPKPESPRMEEAPPQEAPPQEAPSEEPPAPAPSDDAQAPVAAVAPRTGVQDGGLPRRVRLGLTFVETPDGMAIRSVAPRSAAAAAGLQEGDVVTLINGAPVADAVALSNRLKFLHPGEPTMFSVRRAGEPSEIQVVPDEAIREGDLEAKVEYNAFDGARGRLRSVWSLPARGLSTPRPAVLVVRGVGASAADAPGNSPFRDLAFHLARRGVIAVRYDPEGVGDSEGPPNPTVDFQTEVADARAALAHLRDDPRVDPDRVILIGQGTGGGVAAVVARTDAKLAGLAVVGTIARPLLEYLLDSRRQQMALAGVPPAEVDDVLHEHVAVFASVLVTGREPKSDTPGIVGDGGTLMGKSPEFWRQYDAVNFGKLYSGLHIPVLNAIGEFDFVSTLADHRAVADALKAKGQDGQILVVLDRTDHDLRSFDTREAAFAAFGSTDAPVNDRAVAAIAEWVEGQSKQTAAR